MHGSLHTGSLLLLYGLWWMFSTYWIYLTQKKCSKSRHHDSKSLKSGVFDHDPNDPLTHKSWIPQPFLKRVPLEPILKVILSGLSVIVFLFTDTWKDSMGNTHFRLISNIIQFDGTTGKIHSVSRLFHICLVSVLLISGIVDLVSLCIKLPRATSQLFFSFALYCEAFLLFLHSHGHDPLDTFIHQSMTTLAIVTAVFSTLRLLNPKNLFINAGVAGSMILQGTHFIQAGLILHGRIRWDGQFLENVKFVGTLSVWHLYGVSIFMMISFIAMKTILAKLGKTKRFSSLAVDELEADAMVQERESLIAGPDAEDNTSGTSQDNIRMYEHTGSPT